ncbi:MAG: hypothetical protein AAGI53_17460, partial [Planctomycetota bacterium]
MTRRRVSTARPTSGPSVPDEERLLLYSPAWQLLEEVIDDDLVSSSNTPSRAQQFWGDRYIDDAVARRIDRDGDGSYLDETHSLFFYLTDRMFSVRAVVDAERLPSPAIVEELSYSPYGEVFRRSLADLALFFGTQDGSDIDAFVVPFVDATAQTIDGANFDSGLDFRRSGNLD